MVAITDAARLQLHNRVRTVLGEQEGDTLMAHMPPVGWQDVATKQDLDLAVTKLTSRMDVVEERLSHCATTADLERGFRRQSIWIASLFIGQNLLWFYMLGQLAD